MIHPGTTNSIRYLKRQNLIPIMQIQKDYYRELINSYGVDAVYYRHDSNAYETPSGIVNYDYVYGEDTTKTYFLSADIILYLDVQGDSAILNKFGIETDGDAECFILIDDFTNQFRDKIGTIETSLTSAFVSGEIKNWNSDVSGYIISNKNNFNFFNSFSGITSSNFNLTGFTNSFTVPFSSVYFQPPLIHNDYIFRPTSYTNREVFGTLSGNISGTIDLTGNGILNGIVSGNLDYHLEEGGKYGGKAPGWKIAPQVGDFFRINFNDDNHEEYEITKIQDRNLQPDGLNPHLFKYVWQISVVRRDPSYESVLGDSISTIDPSLIDNPPNEEETTNKDEFNTLSNDISNSIFDYNLSGIDSTDLKNSDNVYGGYGYNGN